MLKNYLKRCVKYILSGISGVFGYSIISRKVSQQNVYCFAATTLQAAKSRGQSVRAYVEELWEQQGCTEKVLQEMRQTGCLETWDRICEIGPGTGRYLELVLQACSPKQYDIYEIADDWATYLAQTYAPIVVRQPTDGKTLSSTPTASCGLVHVHGVFVYLPFLHAFEYFAEMDRICAPQGYLVFDFYPDQDFTLDMIKHWLSFPERYPVILPQQRIVEYFQDIGYRLIREFKNKHSHSYSHYLILRKRG